MKQNSITGFSVLGIALFSIALIGCTEEVRVINAADLNLEAASLPTPAVAWGTGRTSPDANGDYCCSCQKLSGQQDLRLASVGPNFDVCVGCELACTNDGHQGADGTRSRAGDCSN